MDLIKKKIKERYGKVEDFCDQKGYDYKGFSRKRKSLFNSLDKWNEFLKPLGLKLIIVDDDIEC